jgi:hypothetical protein
MTGSRSKPRLKYILICQVVISVIILSGISAGYEKFHAQEHESTPKLDYDSLFAIASPLADSPDGRQVIENCLNAYGGIPKLEELKSVRFTWRMLAMMSSDSVNVVKIMATGRRYKIERERPNGFEVRMIDENRAWFQNADTVIELNGGRYKAELFSYLVLSMPLALKTERFDDIRYGRRADDPLHYLYLDKLDSLMVVLGIDPSDYMIKKAEGLIRQEDETFVFINQFGDFKKLNGFMFPRSLTNVSMGLTVGQSALKDVEVNIDVARSCFSPVEPIGD